MTVAGPEAFLLLTLNNVHLTSGQFSLRDVLALECLTVPDAPPGARDVFLVLRLGNFEAAVDPERHVSLSTARNGDRTYTFHRTSSDPTEIVLRVPAGGEKLTHESADLDMFDGILEQYANFRHGAHIEPTPDGAAFQIQDSQQDYRGKLVLVDQDNGEVLGTVGDEKTHLHAEAGLTRPGHEHDPVYIDVPADGELDPEELFVRAIPPGEHNFITRGASMLSTGISGAANLLTRGMTTASSAYIARAVPHASVTPTRDGSPPVLPPRPIQWMTSAAGKKHMQTANQYSGKAVVVSGKTINVVEGIIKRMVGGAQTAYDKGKTRMVPPPPPNGAYPNGAYPASDAYSPAGGLTPKYGTSLYGSPSGSRSGSPQPPAYRPTPGKLVTGDASYPSSKGLNISPTEHSPSYRSPSSAGYGAPPPLPGRKDGRLSPHPPASPNPDKLDTKDRIFLSANLVLGTLGKSGKQIIDVGSDRLSAVIGHKYGTEAGESTRVLTGTVRNVGLVYVDVTGLGRRALLKTAGKEFVKAKIKGRKYKLRTDTNGEVVQAEPATPMPGSPRLK